MEFTESGLIFQFADDRWRVHKWDDLPPFKGQFDRLPKTAAVDFVALFDERTLYLIEVKNYSEHERTKEKDIDVEFGHKVRDTVAGLVGAFRSGQYDAWARPAMDALRGDKRRVVLVLWYEPHASGRRTGAPDMRRVAAILQPLRQEIERKMKWLHAVVEVRATSDNASLPDGLTVRRV